jgi:hypothetical protein
MTNLVSEREAGLRTALRNMGMLDSSYWASWAAFDLIMALLVALLILIYGGRVRQGPGVWGPPWVCGCEERDIKPVYCVAEAAQTSESGQLPLALGPILVQPLIVLIYPAPERTKRRQPIRTSLRLLHTRPGLILQFPYFKRNDSSLLFMLFWLFGLAMTSYSYCLSVFM